MTKLIVTDLDATLLHSDKTFPQGIFELVRKIMDKGITFCFASGRQLANMQKILGEVVDRAYIIAENGSLLSYCGKILFRHLMTASECQAVLDSLVGVDGYPLVCLENEARYAEADDEAVSELKKFYTSTRQVTSDKLSGDACKIAVYKRGRSAEIAKSVKELGGMELVVSGDDWFDIAKVKVNKATALAHLLDMLGISAKDAVAFGDQMNDEGMLKLCGKSYAVANANPYIREQFEVIDSNDNDGVKKKLEEILAKFES